MLLETGGFSDVGVDEDGKDQLEKYARLIGRVSHLHHAEPGLFRGWPFGMEWSPIGSPDTSKSILPEIPSAT